MQLRQIGIAVATTLLAAYGDIPVLAENNPATTAAPKPPACAAPENRQFDFWIGDWEVRDPAGKVVGENHISSLHEGCVLFENYRAGKFSGSSVNIYDAERGKWHQTWVDSSGGLLVIEGGFVGGKMILAGETVDVEKPGGKIDNRITWEPLPDGRVRQLWETTKDKGTTWTTAFDGYYAKKK